MRWFAVALFPVVALASMGVLFALRSVPVISDITNWFENEGLAVLLGYFLSIQVGLVVWATRARGAIQSKVEFFLLLGNPTQGIVGQVRNKSNETSSLGILCHVEEQGITFWAKWDGSKSRFSQIPKGFPFTFQVARITGAALEDGKVLAELTLYADDGNQNLHIDFGSTLTFDIQVMGDAGFSVKGKCHRRCRAKAATEAFGALVEL